tara:strand:+ start:284 stop:538 length:255 start_codon:yes stop_codon:yes gene_type:complete
MAVFIYPKIQTGDDLTEENITSEINGERTVFTLANNYAGGTLRVYHNGVRQVRGTSFTETSSNTFTTVFTAVSGDFLLVDYVQV